MVFIYLNNRVVRMSDQQLSQEEIDKLKSQIETGINKDLSEDEEGQTIPKAPQEKAESDAKGGEGVGAIELTEDELDVVGEIGNISMGKAATVMSTLLGHRVEISTPTVSIVSWHDVKVNHPVPCLIVEIAYSDGLEGGNVLILTLKDANIIANIMDEEEHPLDEVMDDYRQDVVAEAMNQMIGGAVTAISGLLDRDVNISPPQVRVVNFSEGEIEEHEPLGDEVMVQVEFRFEVEGFIESNMLQLMSVSFAREAAKYLLEEDEEEAIAPAPSPEPVAQVPIQDQPAAQMQTEESAPKQEPQAAPSRQEPVSPQAPSQQAFDARDVKPPVSDEPPVSVNMASFNELDETGTNGKTSDANLDLILDVDLELSVELGRTRMKIKDVLNLGPGAVIELNKLAGEPVDIFINERLIARGEVVVIDEDFGVRITEIINTRLIS